MGIQGECFLAIHTLIVLISRFQNFQEVIPFLLEAAARFFDFGHSINKIKEKEELELALTNPSVGIDRRDDCLAMYHKNSMPTAYPSSAHNA